MIKEVIHKGHVFVGADYTIERPEFGEENYQEYISQLSQIIADLPEEDNLKLDNFSFRHPFYDLDFTFGFILKTSKALKALLTHFTERDSYPHRVFCCVFLPDSKLKYRLKQ